MRRRRLAAVPAGARDLVTGSPDPALLPDLAAALRDIDAPQRLYGAEPVLPELAERRRRGVRRRRRARRRGSARSTARSTGSSACSPRTSPPATPSPSRIPAGPACSTSRARSACGSCRWPSTSAGWSRTRSPPRRRGARAVVVTPRGHNPCGSAFDAARAGELRAVAGRRRARDRGRPPRAGGRHAVAHAGRRARALGGRALGLQVARPRPAAGRAGRRRDDARARRGPPGARPRLGQRPRPAARRAAVGRPRRRRRAAERLPRAPRGARRAGRRRAGAERHQPVGARSPTSSRPCARCATRAGRSPPARPTASPPARRSASRPPRCGRGGAATGGRDRARGQPAAADPRAA